MAFSKPDKILEKLSNHLEAEDCRQVNSASVRNSDTADVDLDAYSEQVYSEPAAGKGFRVAFFLVILAALAVFIYLVTGGTIPWK